MEFELTEKIIWEVIWHLGQEVQLQKFARSLFNFIILMNQMGRISDAKDLYGLVVRFKSEDLRVKIHELSIKIQETECQYSNI